MICAWQELMQVLPIWLRDRTDKLGREELQELRLRLDQPPELVCSKNYVFYERTVTGADLSFVVNAASRYSPWSAATISQGYLTAPGGHRIGVCGEAVIDGGRLQGIRNIHSLCVRVARDFPGIAKDIPQTGSVLIIGKPGAGKTTLLRDLIRQRSGKERHSVAVVDERGELFPSGFAQGTRTDILTGCSKGEGIPLVLRTMGPGTIAVDEITAEEDANALCQAGWCGVTLLATAHGASIHDLKQRPVYRRLLQYGLFQTLVILREDKSWWTERINL